jgi:type 2 lantibiotic biosynthesis protein LanM
MDRARNLSREIFLIVFRSIKWGKGKRKDAAQFVVFDWGEYHSAQIFSEMAVNALPDDESFVQRQPDGQKWYAGLTLAERLGAKIFYPSPAQRNKQTASVPKTRWRADNRAAILQAKQRGRIPGEIPSWRKTFEAAYDCKEPHTTSTISKTGFLSSVEPLLLKARTEVMATLRRSADLYPPHHDNLVALISSFESSLHNRLFDTISKTIVLELAVASKHGALAGNNSKDRFEFFCNCLAEPIFAKALLGQYPVLVRRVVTLIDNWKTSTLTLLSRLSLSLPALREKFFGNVDPGPLLCVESSGDTHHDGQEVSILTFASGQRIVYKPRSVAMENFFFGLVGWINRNGYALDLKAACVLDESDYGWMEYVETKQCHTKLEIERFFRRQGAQLVLAYIFGAGDIHYENVIAHGEYPVLVDLEALFQTPLLPTALSGATALGWRALRMSIMGSLILPEPTFADDDQHSVDFSALGFREGQLTPFRVPIWRAGGTDRMRLQHDRIVMKGSASLPMINSMPAQATAYVEQIVTGFSEMYAFMRNRKNELLSERGHIQGCFGKPVRQIFRSTGTYERLLDASCHPRFLTDAISTEAFLHNRLRAESNGAPWLKAIEDIEVASMLSGDIPYFVTHVGDRTASTADNSIDAVLPGDGWNECLARLETMNDADLDRQTWLARIAMADLRSPPMTNPPQQVYRSSDPTSAELISAAVKIGERVCELNIGDVHRATWLIPAHADEDRLYATVAGYELYDGLSGIALFLSYLGDLTGRKTFLDVASAAMSEALSLYDISDHHSLPLGAFDGIGGLAYALAELAVLTERPSWFGRAISILKDAAMRAADSSRLDLISGQSGLIVAGLAVYARTTDTELFHLLRPLAQKLNQLAIQTANYAVPILPTEGDAGLAHGRAGIGFALSRWAKATGDNIFRATAMGLIRFDLKTMNAMHLETSKLHQLNRKGAFDLRWCRGVLGVALAIIDNLPKRSSRGKWYDTLLNRTIDEIVNSGVNGPICLCHGVLGHFELLQSAAEHGLLHNIQGRNAWIHSLLERLLSGDWVGDTAHSLESPSLMVGLAGTGYALLRAAHPQRVPSLLTMGKPAARPFIFI